MERLCGCLRVWCSVVERASLAAPGHPVVKLRGLECLWERCLDRLSFEMEFLLSLRLYSRQRHRTLSVLKIGLFSRNRAAAKHIGKISGELLHVNWWTFLLRICAARPVAGFKGQLLGLLLWSWRPCRECSLFHLDFCIFNG